VTRPQKRWQSAGSGWFNTVEVAVVAIAGLLAPIVLILALVLGWGTLTLIVSAAVTVVVWGGAALLLGPVYRRAARKQQAQVPTEVAKLPELAARYGLTYAERSDALALTIGRHAAARGSCTYVLSGRIGGRPAAVCWYERTRAGTDLASLMLVVELPAVMPELSVESKTATQVAPGSHRLQVQFEDDDFNNRYLVAPADHSPESQRYAVDLISQRAIDWLLSVEPFWFTIDGQLVVAEGSSVLDADDVQQLLDRAIVLAHVVDAVPEFAWKQYGKPAQALSGLG